MAIRRYPAQASEPEFRSDDRAMKAVVCKTRGAPATLAVEEIAAPSPGAGEVRIVVHAAGVNVADTLMVAGQYQFPPPLPFSPGFEVSGEIAACGDGVAELRPGDRVLAALPFGGYAEEVVAPAVQVAPLPDAMDYVTAAAFPVAYGAAHLALTYRAPLAAGATLLVCGATGNVGRAAVQVGKRLGATVIATARGPERLPLARAAGADHALDAGGGDGIVTRVRELTGGRGVDLVFDTVGGDLFDAALDCVAWEGRILVVGFAGGRVPELPTLRTLLGNCAVVGFDWTSYLVREPRRVRDSLAAALRWHGEGDLAPRVGRVLPLAEAPGALAAVAGGGADGKLVLTTGRG